MLHEAIFLATYNATMMNKKTFQVAEGVSHVYNIFSNTYNYERDGGRAKRAKDEL